MGVNWNDNDTGEGYVFAFHNTEICSIDVAFSGILQKNKYLSVKGQGERIRV